MDFLTVTVTERKWREKTGGEGQWPSKICEVLLQKFNLKEHAPCVIIYLNKSIIYPDKSIIYPGIFSVWGRFEWFGVKLHGILMGISYLISWNSFFSPR